MTLYNIISPGALVAGQPEDISVILANLQSIASVLNGNLDDSNQKDASLSAIKLVPGPAGSKLVTQSGPALWVPDTGYGTSFPSSPVDGQEYIWVDSLTAPTVTWRFRYNAGSTSPYKWEYIGGVPASQYIDADETTTSTSYVDLTTPGPQFTIPRNGDYTMRWQTETWVSANAATYMALKRGSAAAVDADSAIISCNAGWTNNTSRELRVLGAVAGDLYKLQYRVSSAATAHWIKRALSVTPVRVA